MEDVKTRKLKEMADKLQLKEKQNQELLQQQQEQSLKAQEEAQKRKVEEEAAIDTAKKAAAEEHNIWEAEQKIELDRRLLQEKEIEAQRSTEWNVIRNQEHELFMMLFNDIADEIDKEFNEWQESITQVAKKRRAKHHHFCFDIILQWVSMAECVTEYRVEMGINLPINEWREWKTLFIKGAILPAELPVEPLPEEPPAEKEVRLAKEAVADYIQEKGEYKSPEGVTPIGTNQELGAILEHIHALSDSLITPPPRPDLSMHSLKLAVVGVPYADHCGKAAGSGIGNHPG